MVYEVRSSMCGTPIGDPVEGFSRPTIGLGRAGSMPTRPGSGLSRASSSAPSRRSSGQNSVGATHTVCPYEAAISAVAQDIVEVNPYALFAGDQGGGGATTTPAPPPLPAT